MYQIVNALCKELDGCALGMAVPKRPDLSPSPHPIRSVHLEEEEEDVFIWGKHWNLDVEVEGVEV